MAIPLLPLLDFDYTDILSLFFPDRELSFSEEADTGGHHLPLELGNSVGTCAQERTDVGLLARARQQRWNIHSREKGERKEEKGRSKRERMERERASIVERETVPRGILVISGGG